MNCFTPKCIYYFDLDWHTAINTSVDDLLASLRYYNYTLSDKLIIRFIYKQHHHYFRCIGKNLYTYAYDHSQNSTPLINRRNSLFVAPEVNYDLINVKLLDNVPLHIVAPTVTDLFNKYKAFTVAYGLTRIDFDLEGTWIAFPYNAANIRNSQAIKMLQDYYKSIGKSISACFTLPILPTGLTDDGINILQLALNAGVDIGGVNSMTMDYGDYAAPDPQGKMGMYGIQAITSLFSQLKTLYHGTKTDAQLWAMIGTTPMLGVNDVQDEVFSQSDATQTLNFANSKNIGMISMWSSNRDMAGKSGIIQTDYEFSKIFNQYI